MDKRLAEFVDKLKSNAGENLKAVVLYGSAVTGEFHKDYSDFNLVCVFERMDGDVLHSLNPAVEWWAKQGHKPPMVFSLEELARSADVFAIELLDIKAARRVLFGDDPFAALEVPTHLHRLQVERELRTHVVRLRERYLSIPHHDKDILALMSESVSSFTTLFRHAILAIGGQPPQQKHEAVDRLASQLQFDPSPFHTVLEVREGKRKASELDIHALFREYLKGVTRVADEVDRIET